MNKAEAEALRLEVKCRKELCKRLTYPMELLKKAADKELCKRKERVEALSDYKSYDELQEAYGYGAISEEEFEAAARALEDGEDYIDKASSPVELAAKMLQEYIAGLHKEIRSLEFELLPAEEQLRILRQREELLARRREREHED